MQLPPCGPVIVHTCKNRLPHPWPAPEPMRPPCTGYILALHALSTAALPLHASVAARMHAASSSAAGRSPSHVGLVTAIVENLRPPPHVASLAERIITNMTAGGGGGGFNGLHLRIEDDTDWVDGSGGADVRRCWCLEAHVTDSGSMREGNTGQGVCQTKRVCFGALSAPKSRATVWNR